MAKCDEGYRCEVCGRDVEAVIESDLYLRFVLKDVSLDWLHRLPERHIRCNPALAQYVVDDAFSPVVCEGAFAKDACDPTFVREETERVTRGWKHLQTLPASGLPLPLYPLDSIL